MADAIISVVAERLMAILEEQMRNEVSLVRGVKEEARKLSDELRSVRNVLDDAEMKGFTNKNIRQWLKRLEYASYDMDDVLDEWNASLIKLQKEQHMVCPSIPQSSCLAFKKIGTRRDSNSSSVASTQHKVCAFIPQSSCLGFKKIATRRDIALKIKLVKAQLDEILKERNKYDFFENQGTSHSLNRVTTSFFEIDDIKGRDFDRDNLVSKIISHSTSPSQGDRLGLIQISSIVGTGGIGKTTLAQLVYNDSRVKDCFPLRIWICVSDPLDEASIAREIVEKAQGNAPSTGTLDGLLELVQKSISGKKFLLVLDDVWNGDDAKWLPLKSSLKSSCAKGSNILVTTRNEIVARNIGTNEHGNEIHHLGQLSDEDCWSILSHIAFSGKSEGMKKELSDIGWGIAQKCKGLPLAAKTLGSLLRLKNTVKEWEDVLNNEIWRLESAKVDLFPHLLLSYNDLSPAQKRCFSYCAVFPKDHEIEVDDLIRKWMALGYLSYGGGNAVELELIGREYFNSLANRCLFENFEKDHFSESVILKCKMHDIVHDFCQYLREEDDLKTSEEASSCKTCSPLVSHVRKYRSIFLEGDRYCDLHVCDCLASARVLDCGTFRNISTEIKKFIHVRNLSFDHVSVKENDFKTICMFYNLQSLVLRNFEVREIPSEIGNLVELRYLALSSCGVKEISSEIGNLSQLRHLDLSYNSLLKELPERISNLHELINLNVSYCDNLSEPPQGIDGLINLKHLLVGFRQFLKYPQGLAKLTSLQTLEYFNGGGDWSKLGWLNKLNRLSGSLYLRIKLVDDEDDIVEQAGEAELKKKLHLQKLTIEFPYYSITTEVSMKRRLDVMDALEPHPNLQSLEIQYYTGSRFPEWIASPLFHQLRQIKLSHCYSCLSLPHLGKLPCLEVLAIDNMGTVKFVGREFLGISSSSSIGFPKLKKLQFWGCDNWKEWEDITAEEGESAAVSVMPSLIQLDIKFCHNLKELPHRLLRKASSLQTLIVLHSIGLLDSYGEGGRLNKFVSHIPYVYVYW